MDKKVKIEKNRLKGILIGKYYIGHRIACRTKMTKIFIFTFMYYIILYIDID